MTICDKGIIAVVLILIGLLSYNTYFHNADNPSAVVSINGEVARSFSSEELSSEGIFTIPIDNGNAEIEIRNGRVRLLPIPKKLCPKGICSAMGWVKRPGASIICLPNRLIVQIIGYDPKGFVDAVVR